MQPQSYEDIYPYVPSEPLTPPLPPSPSMPMPAPQFIRMPKHVAHRKKPSTIGIAAFLTSLFAICIHWLMFFPPPFSIIMYVIILVLAIFGIIAGWFTAGNLLYTKCASHKKDKYGFAGFTIGLCTLILSTSWLLLSLTFMWYWL